MAYVQTLTPALNTSPYFPEPEAQSERRVHQLAGPRLLVLDGKFTFTGPVLWSLSFSEGGAAASACSFLHSTHGSHYCGSAY